MGYSHLTVPEDCFYIPAQVGVTLALSATHAIPVGTSIVSALTTPSGHPRHGDRRHQQSLPGRFRPGIGLGLPDWLRQMGIMPGAPVAAMRERISALQRLLTGEVVTFEGEHVSLDAVGITHFATADVPITMGVMGPQMLQLAGELADVTLFRRPQGWSTSDTPWDTWGSDSRGPAVDLRRWCTRRSPWPASTATGPRRVEGASGTCLVSWGNSRR